MNNFASVGIAAGLSMYGIAFPEMTGAMLVFLILTIGLDLCTGIRASHKEGKVISSNAYNGTIDKCLSYFAFISVSYLVSFISSNVLMTPLPWLLIVTMSLLLSRELISILENCMRLGFKPPVIITRMLNATNENLENQDKKDGKETE